MTRPPLSSRALPPVRYAKRVRPKTYSVAVYLVGAIALLQLGMLISVFWLRAMVVSVNVGVPRAKSGASVFPPGSPNIPSLPRPSAPELPSLPGLATTTKKPALLSVPTVSDTLAQVSTLNEEAQILIHQNDLKHAAQILINAEDLDPRNPTTLKNLADTYYLANDSVSARNYWQRLADLGPGVGTVYALAKDHVLLLSSTSEANPLSQRSSLPRNVYIGQVEKSPIETSSGQPHFHLRAVLMRKDPKMPFDQKNLQVYVIFYQSMPNGELAPDLAQRKGAFENTLLFWNDKLREPFDVDYVMPTPGPGSPAGNYYGFVIGIYYNKVLQDVRSEPTDLDKRIPLPQAIE